MKKALQISIAQTLFTLEDDAYTRLEQYLATVRDHFARTEGHEEIVADIESRIAEQLHESKEQVISLKTIERVLTQMGDVEDFDDDEDISVDHAQPSARLGTKRLYRNPDDKYIAGVCSGLAAYFGIDTLWVRIAFVVLAFANGFGILAYIVMWVLVPEAKNGGQKLEMAGTPVTLETISETVRERIAEVNDNRSGVRSLITLPFRFIGGLIAFIMGIIGPVLRIAIGALFVLVSTISLVAVLITSGVVQSKELLVASDVPLRVVLTQPLATLTLASIALAAIIPLLFLFIGGITMLQRKSLISAPVSFGLLGVWFITLVVSGFGVASAVGNYQQIVNSSPAYQEVTQPLPLGASFRALKITHGIDVEIVASSTQALSATGRARDIAHVRTHIENGVLSIEPLPQTEKFFCLFCFYELPRLTLYTPSIDDIDAAYGSRIHADALPTSDAVALALMHGSSMNLTLKATSLHATADYGSSLTLKGIATALEASLDHGSYLDADAFKTQDASITANFGSSAVVSTSQTLKATVDHGSEIMYLEDPAVTKSSNHGSTVERLYEPEAPAAPEAPTE